MSAEPKLVKPDEKQASFRSHGAGRRQHGHISVVVFLLVVFGLAVLCVGIVLTLLVQPKQDGAPAATDKDGSARTAQGDAPRHP